MLGVPETLEDLIAQEHAAQMSEIDDRTIDRQPEQFSRLSHIAGIWAAANALLLEPPNGDQEKREEPDHDRTFDVLPVTIGLTTKTARLAIRGEEGVISAEHDPFSYGNVFIDLMLRGNNQKHSKIHLLGLNLSPTDRDDRSKTPIKVVSCLGSGKSDFAESNAVDYAHSKIQEALALDHPDWDDGGMIYMKQWVDYYKRYFEPVTLGT